MPFCKAYSKLGTYKHGLPCLAHAKKGSRYCRIHSEQEIPEDCTICYNPMFKPFQFECGHEICEECAAHITQTVNQLQPLCRCPLCRTPTFRITEHVLWVKKNVEDYKKYMQEYASKGTITLGPGGSIHEREGDAAKELFYWNLNYIFLHPWVFVHDEELFYVLCKTFTHMNQSRRIYNVKSKYIKLLTKVREMYTRVFFNRIKCFLNEEQIEICEQEIREEEML